MVWNTKCLQESCKWFGIEVKLAISYSIPNELLLIQSERKDHWELPVRQSLLKPWSITLKSHHASVQPAVQWYYKCQLVTFYFQSHNAEGSREQRRGGMSPEHISTSIPTHPPSHAPATAITAAPSALVQEVMGEEMTLSFFCLGKGQTALHPVKTSFSRSNQRDWSCCTCSWQLWGKYKAKWLGGCGKWKQLLSGKIKQHPHCFFLIL